MLRLRKRRLRESNVPCMHALVPSCTYTPKQQQRQQQHHCHKWQHRQSQTAAAATQTTTTAAAAAAGRAAAAAAAAAAAVAVALETVRLGRLDQQQQQQQEQQEEQQHEEIRVTSDDVRQKMIGCCMQGKNPILVNKRHCRVSPILSKVKP